jgi:hypothetical protein
MECTCGCVHILNREPPNINPPSFENALYMLASLPILRQSWHGLYWSTVDNKPIGKGIGDKSDCLALF